MVFIIYVWWGDSYFQIDTQTGWLGSADTPVIEGFSEWLRQVNQNKLKSSSPFRLMRKIVK